MSVIAISGAAGFVGRHLTQELIAHGHRVIALSRPVLYSRDLSAELAGAEACIHLAARAHVLTAESANAQAEFWNSNVGLTQIIALAAKEARVRRFIYLSSAGVLGATSPPQGFFENATPYPHDAYTASKLEAERWLQAHLDTSMELVILRPPLIYGPDAKGNLARLLRLALRGWPLPIGALRAPRSMVAVRNIVDLIRKLSTDAGVVRATMLVADREMISVADLFRAVARYAGHRLWLAPLPPLLIKSLLLLARRSQDVARLTGPFVLRPTIAQAQFGWIPPYSLQGELRRTVLCELGAAAMPNQVER